MSLLLFMCGGGEIRTHGPLSQSPVFKTGAFNHSATPPCVHVGMASCPSRTLPIALFAYAHYRQLRLCAPDEI